MRKTLRKVRRSCLEMQIPHSFVQQYSISFLAEIRNVIILARHKMKGSPTIRPEPRSFTSSKPV